MPHHQAKIWLHLVFSTKNREQLISPKNEVTIHQYIKQQMEEMGCKVRIINGMPDHIHILFLLHPQKSVSDIVKQTKGSSSHWINQNDLVNGKFAWQVGYGIFSVSETNVHKVQNYIKNQKEHHKKKTFKEEYTEFMKAYGFSIDENGRVS